MKNKRVLLKDEVYEQVSEDLALAKSEVEETKEYQAQLSKTSTELSKKIKSLVDEQEKLTQEIHKITNTHRDYGNVLQDLEHRISGYEKQLRDHEWEQSVLDYIKEYDSFYVFLEREIEKEQKRLQEVSPQKIEFTSPADATKKYKAMLEGRNFNQNTMDMRSFLTHYDQAIRDMAETRANKQKVTIDQLRVPLQVVSRCVANRAITSLWYS